MNEHILMVQGFLLYPENYTKDQLKQNYRAAYAAYADDANSAYAAYAAYLAAAYDAYLAAAYAAAFDIFTARAEYWIDSYFNETGENRQDYIDAIHKENNNESI